MPDLPAGAITAEMVRTLTVALAKAAAVPGATAGDCYRAGLAAAAPALRAQGAAAERARIAEAIIAEARRMGYVAGEVATAAWPHLADFVADLLDSPEGTPS